MLDSKPTCSFSILVQEMGVIRALTSLIHGLVCFDRPLWSAFFGIQLFWYWKPLRYISWCKVAGSWKWAQSNWYVPKTNSWEIENRRPLAERLKKCPLGTVHSRSDDFYFPALSRIVTVSTVWWIRKYFFDILGYWVLSSHGRIINFRLSGEM